jgi:TonB family protein
MTKFFIAIAALTITIIAAAAENGASRLDPRIDPSWNNEVQCRFHRFLYYPKAAYQRREEGRVELYYVVDRTGHVLGSKIFRSSGHPDLDDAVMWMIEHAQPLPPFPPSMLAAALPIVQSVLFEIPIPPSSCGDELIAFAKLPELILTFAFIGWPNSRFGSDSRP